LSLALSASASCADAIARLSQLLGEVNGLLVESIEADGGVGSLQTKTRSRQGRSKNLSGLLGWLAWLD
jgi:hypothetical protein